MTDIHAMNKLKVMLGGVINGVATIAFIAARTIVWPQAIVMTAGSILGGYSSAIFLRSCRKPGEGVRDFGWNGHDHLFLHPCVPMTFRNS